MWIGNCTYFGILYICNVRTVDLGSSPILKNKDTDKCKWGWPKNANVNLLDNAHCATLVWPQWWSFADVNQQGIDFSKKISKIKIIFWFDFHKCSHGPSKIRRHFRNKSRSILRSSKNVFYKKCGPKLIFFSEKKIWKNRMMFDIENWLSKSIFYFKNHSNLSEFFFHWRISV